MIIEYELENFKRLQILLNENLIRLSPKLKMSGTAILNELKVLIRPKSDEVTKLILQTDVITFYIGQMSFMVFSVFGSKTFSLANIRLTFSHILQQCQGAHG